MDINLIDQVLKGLGVLPALMSVVIWKLWKENKRVQDIRANENKEAYREIKDVSEKFVRLFDNLDGLRDIPEKVKFELSELKTEIFKALSEHRGKD